MVRCLMAECACTCFALLLASCAGAGARASISDQSLCLRVHAVRTLMDSLTRSCARSCMHTLLISPSRTSSHALRHELTHCTLVALDDAVSARPLAAPVAIAVIVYGAIAAAALAPAFIKRVHQGAPSTELSALPLPHLYRLVHASLRLYAQRFPRIAPQVFPAVLVCITRGVRTDAPAALGGNHARGGGGGMGMGGVGGVGVVGA